ncbi:Uncharacterised protein [uncultured Prevotella sp.]|nr:Uncharacterised protein [uncultured Prevotella sp.]
MPFWILQWIDFLHKLFQATTSEQHVGGRQSQLKKRERWNGFSRFLDEFLENATLYDY